MAVYRLSDTFSVAPAWAALNNNLLHNGAMQVAQRGTSTASITTTGYYTADRWEASFTALGTWTQSVENDAPTGSGFAKSLKMLVTTADGSPAAGDTALVQQKIEGANLQRIAKGTASAQQITLSFWVKSNATGTYVARLQDVDNTRQVCASYTISSSATWERKTITFPADTTGALDNDNASSLQLQFWLGAGSDRTSGTLQTTWAAITTANIAVGQTNLAATINNYWQITGVQLEAGPVATPFEFKPYDQELRECQRYYTKVGPGEAYGRVGFGTATTAAVAHMAVFFPTIMRTTPSGITVTGSWRSSDGANVQNVTPTLTATSSNGPSCVSVSASGTFTQFRPYFLEANNDTTASLGFSADL